MNMDFVWEKVDDGLYLGACEDAPLTTILIGVGTNDGEPNRIWWRAYETDCGEEVNIYGEDGVALDYTSSIEEAKEKAINMVESYLAEKCPTITFEPSIYTGEPSRLVWKRKQ